MKHIKILYSLLFLSFISTAFAALEDVDEDFSGTTVSDWQFGRINSGSGLPYLTAETTTPEGTIDSDGNGWLRLTESKNSQSAYAIYTGEAVTAQNRGIYCKFDFATWNKSAANTSHEGADGISFFIYDGDVTPSEFRVGADGGSLGYANKNGVEGLKGGYIGIGIDEWGNYSNDGEKRVGTTDGTPTRNGYLYPNTIAVRGSEKNNWNYLVGTADTDVPNLPRLFSFPDDQRRPNFETARRTVMLLITPKNQLTVYMRYGTGDLDPIFSADLSNQIRPDTIRVGFAGSTGGSKNVHEIRNVKIKAFQSVSWDAELNDNDGDTTTIGTEHWQNPYSWEIDKVPNENNFFDLQFDNQTGLTSTQNIDLVKEQDVITMTIDAPFAYTFNNQTLNFKGEEDEAMAISVTNTNGNPSNGSEFHSFNCGIKMNDTLNININTPDEDDAAIYFNGTIDNVSNLVRFTGSGRSIITGAIIGSGGLGKEGSGSLWIIDEDNTITANTTNTYAESTLIKEGNVHLSKGIMDGNNNGALGTGTIEVQDGAELHLEADNQIYNGSDIMLSGGAFHLNGHEEHDDPNI